MIQVRPRYLDYYNAERLKVAQKKKFGRVLLEHNPQGYPVVKVMWQTDPYPQKN